MKKQLLVTDLDNTLYDWVGFFAPAFREMVGALVELLGQPEDRLLDEFQTLHKRYGNSEQPFVILELPAVLERFEGAAPDRLLMELSAPLEAFNRIRAKRLKLYPGVRDTLHSLTERGVTVIGHTEAIAVNAFYRLSRLDVHRRFRRLYALEGHLKPRPVPFQRSPARTPPDGFVVEVPKEERKPNPRLLLDLCEREGFRPDETVYVGDSRTRDVAMALGAGVTAVWASYGANNNTHDWDTLVRVTHWSDDDVKRESRLRESAQGQTPDLVVEQFTELSSLF